MDLHSYEQRLFKGNAYVILQDAKVYGPKEYRSRWDDWTREILGPEKRKCGGYENISIKSYAGVGRHKTVIWNNCGMTVLWENIKYLLPVKDREAIEMEESKKNIYSNSTQGHV